MLDNIKLGIANLSYGYSLQTLHPSYYPDYFDSIFNSGVRDLELADGYVNIHDYLRETNNKWNIQFKIRFDKKKYFSKQKKYIYEIVNSLLERSHHHNLITVMFHNSLDIEGLEIESICEEIDQVLGFTLKKGISLYPEQYKKNYLNYFSVYQLPFNVLDKRIIDLGIYKVLKSSNKDIQFRSVYLKGMLSQVKSYSQHKSYPLKFFFEISKKYNIEPAQMAYQFVRQFDKNAFLILGADNSRQINILAEWEKMELDCNLYNLLLNIKEQNLEIIDPRYWKT